MKTFLLSIILFASAFSFGVLIDQTQRYSLVSLEEISKNSKFYDGKNVELITYVRLDAFDKKDFVVGEPFEKSEQTAFLNLEENSVDLDFLQKQLSENLSANKYKRVKVRVRGKLVDNCKLGISSLACCMGGSLEIIVKNIEQVGDIEDYTVPSKFQVKSH